MKEKSEFHHDGWPAIKTKVNWFKVPNCFFDLISQVTSLAELKVILYILRHTRGFHNDQPKWITLDEFQYGRKRKDGTRMDAGLNLSKVSVINGLRRAVGHGHLVETVDKRDLGRIKKFYALRTKGTKSIRCKQSKHRQKSDVKNLNTTCKETIHRTEKETIRKKNNNNNNNRKKKIRKKRKENNKNSNIMGCTNEQTIQKQITSSKSSPSTPSTITPFDIGCALQLKSTYPSRDGKKFNARKSAVHFCSLRQRVKGNQNLILTVLDWYCNHLDHKDIPFLLSGKGFVAQFDEINKVRRTINGQVINTENLDSSTEGVVRRLSNVPWPKNSQRLLISMVDRALKRLHHFCSCLYSIEERGDPQTEDTPRTAQFFRETLEPVSGYIEEWFWNVYNQISNWYEWDGNMRPFEFSISHRNFVQYFKDEFQRYSHRDPNQAWNDLMEAVNLCK